MISKTLIGGAIAGIALALMAILAGIQQAPELSLGGAGDGLTASLDVATTTTVGPQAVRRVTLFSQKTDCEARIVTTTGNSAIMINFGEPSTPGNLSSTSVSGTAGHWQAASTTVAYDAELYGCGLWTAYGYASTSVTVSEF